MHSKFKNLESDWSWHISVIFHGLLIVLVAASLRSPVHRSVTIDMKILEAPQSAPKAVDIRQTPPKEKVQPIVAPAVKKVFGISQKALTSDAGEAIEVKAGNTLAKAPDNEKADPNLADLPVPTDEYLVTEMPQVGKEVKAEYPDEARRRGVEGVVTFDLLIDDLGAVKQAVLVAGPGFGLNEAAAAAVKQFRFRPARMGAKNVAVRIRYAYRFILEK